MRHGFSVISAEPNDAVEALRSGTLVPDLLVTNRPHLFTYEAHDIPLLYIAAFPDPREVSGFRRSHMLRKPFRPEQLVSAIGSLLGDDSAS